MKYQLGEIRSDKNGFETLSKIARESNNLYLDNLEIDFTFCPFFEANMAAPFHAVLSPIYNGLNKISIINVQDNIEKILRKNHFLCMFDFSPLLDTNQTTLPFKKFKLQAGDQFSDYLDRYLQGRGIPPMTEALTKKFRQSLFEIFQNTAIHSESEFGVFVCGQFFPQKRRLDFTISDAGIGIRENVRRYFQNNRINSCNAIRWALMEGNTTKRGKRQPGGLGLKLIKEFIRLNRGKIQITSRYGFYEYSPSGESFEKMGEDFPGTSVNIEINTADTSRYCLNTEL